MVSWETTGTLSGSGEYAFTGSGDPFRVAVDVTNLGTSVPIDPTVEPRYSRIGWWTFTDNVNGSSWRYAWSPVFWIEFEHDQYIAPGGTPFYVNGFYGILYRLYPGVEVEFTFEMP